MIGAGTQAVGMAPGPDAFEAVVVKRAAQSIEKALIIGGEITRFERDSLDAVLFGALEKVPDGHALAGIGLQARIDFAEVAMVAIGIDGDFHGGPACV